MRTVSVGIGAKTLCAIGAGATRTIRPTRSGVSMAILSATCPPIEFPTKCARSIPSASMNARIAPDR